MSGIDPIFQPKVSVIIPTFNRANLLARALESVRAQTYPHWEAVVINNFSEDNTIEIVTRLNDPRINLINFQNNGIIAASRNEGIRNSRAVLIAFLDSDDVWYPTKLAHCLEAMTTDVDIVAHGLVYKKNGQHWKRRFSGPQDKATYDQLLYTGNCLMTSTVVVRKETLAAVSGFSEEPRHVGSEDYDLWIRLAKNGARFTFIHDCLGEYDDHEDNFSKEILQCMDAQLAVINRHFSQVMGPSLKEKLKRKRREALIYYTAARGFQDYGKRSQALHFYRRGIRTYPFIFKLYPATLLALCGWPHLVTTCKN